jgi:hypothetical protein
LDEVEISSEDGNSNTPAARDHAEHARNPTSPTHSLSSLSTTVSEIGIEHGDTFLRVKRLKMEEDLDDSLPDPEVISSDEDDEPVPKRRKISSKGAKTKGKKTTGARAFLARCLLTKSHSAGKAVADLNRQKSGGRRKKKTNLGKQIYSDRIWITLPVRQCEQKASQMKTLMRKSDYNWIVYFRSRASTTQLRYHFPHLGTSSYLLLLEN